MKTFPGRGRLRGICGLPRTIPIVARATGKPMKGKSVRHKTREATTIGIVRKFCELCD